MSSAALERVKAFVESWDFAPGEVIESDLYPRVMRTRGNRITVSDLRALVAMAEREDELRRRVRNANTLGEWSALRDEVGRAPPKKKRR